MSQHIVQSPFWGKFKTEYKTKAICVESALYTLHKIPFTDLNFAYCPKVDPFSIRWEGLINSLEENKCISINFDIPNIIESDQKSSTAKKLFEENHCVKSPRNTFAKFNILLDLIKDESTLLASMHPKRRYNIKYSQRKGVKITKGEDKKDFETFFDLFKKTSERQKYYIHPKLYYEKLWEILHPQGYCHILTANFKDKPLASWMLLSYDNVLYYPYGGSSLDERNSFPSDLIGWEAIRLGGKLGCHTFDMWGAAKNPEDRSDPWWGFTNFKLKFGGRLVEYIDSYDYVVNSKMYSLFNSANELRWKLLKLLK